MFTGIFFLGDMDDQPTAVMTVRIDEVPSTKAHQLHYPTDAETQVYTCSEVNTPKFMKEGKEG